MMQCESATYMANKWIGDNSGNISNERSNSNNGNDNGKWLWNGPIWNTEITNINYDPDDTDIY